MLRGLTMSPMIPVATPKPYVVVAGADDGPDGRRVIEAAASSMANRVGGELHIVHLSRGSLARSQATLALLEHGRTSLDGVAGGVHEATACGVAVHIRSGIPWHEIVDEARRRTADLIVVGTHGRTGAARMLMGSQGEQVLRHAPCPVLVVRDVYPGETGVVGTEAECPDCARAQASSDGDEKWCAKHASHGVRSPEKSLSGFGGRSWRIRA
jgi:nucleotide-binding universal stress UspA family protein